MVERRVSVFVLAVAAVPVEPVVPVVPVEPVPIYRGFQRDESIGLLK
jgi:hypothetical protein